MIVERVPPDRLGESLNMAEEPVTPAGGEEALLVVSFLGTLGDFDREA